MGRLIDRHPTPGPSSPVNPLVFANPPVAVDEAIGHNGSGHMLDDTLRELGFQEVALPTDPDVQALERARHAALSYQAQVWMSGRMYDGRLPRTMIAPCEFCALPVPANTLRWRMMRFMFEQPLGGLACLTCYPLGKDQLREVVRGRDKAQGRKTTPRRAA